MRDRRGNLASSNAEALGVERNGHLEVFFFLIVIQRGWPLC